MFHRRFAMSNPNSRVSAILLCSAFLLAACGNSNNEPKEKVEIKAKAEELETTRDQARAHSKPFGLAVIFLQVAILLSSIAGLLKKKLVWYAALPVGAVGLVFFANGFLVFF